ncbi:hypothetical protein BLNAU_11603 [Blattamonas nauphoetae]|uniref:DNA mismatch repair protein HSM3 N-terminal domain-containing protein n=1 Tax=Blattamonas nauphoetae TaxID=2049346 RepID=A0ABQ9XRB9_9EUKA|nr:hypothetical protein BLNAU_11603 [Blattamonas nauphoetae]
MSEYLRSLLDKLTFEYFAELPETLTKIHAHLNDSPSDFDEMESPDFVTAFLPFLSLPHLKIHRDKFCFFLYDLITKTRYIKHKLIESLLIPYLLDIFEFEEPDQSHDIVCKTISTLALDPDTAEVLSYAQTDRLDEFMDFLEDHHTNKQSLSTLASLCFSPDMNITMLASDVLSHVASDAPSNIAFLATEQIRAPISLSETQMASFCIGATKLITALYIQIQQAQKPFLEGKQLSGFEGSSSKLMVSYGMYTTGRLVTILTILLLKDTQHPDVIIDTGLTPLLGIVLCKLLPLVVALTKYTDPTLQSAIDAGFYLMEALFVHMRQALICDNVGVQVLAVSVFSELDKFIDLVELACQVKNYGVISEMLYFVVCFVGIQPTLRLQILEADFVNRLFVRLNPIAIPPEEGDVHIHLFHLLETFLSTPKGYTDAKLKTYKQKRIDACFVVFRPYLNTILKKQHGFVMTKMTMIEMRQAISGMEHQFDVMAEDVKNGLIHDPV